MTEKKYQVFISSTYEDLREERKSAVEAILITKNIPVGMESFTASSQEQFEYIKNCIRNCDYYILIIGGRYGILHPELNLSYTELEFDYAKSLNKPIHIFMYADVNKCRKKDTNLDNISRFRDKVQKENVCQPFKSKAELKGLILTALTQEIINNPQVGWMKCNEISSTYKTQKDCISDLIQTGNVLYPQAFNFFIRWQQMGIYAGSFPEENAFRIWQQQIKEFIRCNNLDVQYLYQFKGSMPFHTVIQEQLILLNGLLASFEYKEVLQNKS